MTAQLLHNACLFDSETATLHAGASVLLEGGTIRAVSLDPLEAPGAQKRDLAGRTLLPGLIDAHVHVTATLPDFFKLTMMPQSLITAQSKTIMEQMLLRGYTSVRDAGGADAGLVQAIEEGHFIGPRLFIAGRPITQTGGHGDARPAFVQGSQTCACCGAVGMIGTVADGVSEVRRAVREEIRNGATHIKVMAGGGVSTPNDPLEGSQYSIEEMTAIVEEAHAAGRYVMAHAYSPLAIQRAIRCGVRSIEHGNLLDLETAQLMVAHGAWLVPTLATCSALGRHGASLGWSAAMLEKLERVKQQGINGLRIAHEAGVKIGFGSDLLGNMHAEQSQEFSLRLSAMPAAEILKSATWVNADMMGQRGKLGSIRPGAAADLLVVDGDPLTDIRLLEHPDKLRLIMKAGQTVHNRLS